MSKKEIVAIIGIVIIALITILAVKGTQPSSAQKYVEITIENEVYKKIPLDNKTSQSFDIHSDLGSNSVVIKNGSVEVIAADCPDLVCVHTKAATNVGDMIVCLPHKLIIEITDK